MPPSPRTPSAKRKRKNWRSADSRRVAYDRTGAAVGGVAHGAPGEPFDFALQVEQA